MKKSIVKKLILIVTIFIVFFSQAYSPLKVSAAKIEWSNPNKSGVNPFKFRTQDALNSALIMQVVGCTGVVDKVSKAVTDFSAKVSRNIQLKIRRQIAEKACRSVEKGVISGIAFAGKEFVAAADVVDFCNGTQQSQDKALSESVDAGTQAVESTKRRDECLNGIAKTLAKNQLTDMTRNTMNWVTSGFNGDPMYVRNVDSFMNRMTDDIVMKELSLFKGQPDYYPYGNDYYRGTILGNISLDNFKDSMKQNLSNYLGSGGLGNDTADVVERYTNNFGEGGWNGWLAFTQYPQNNYLGYTLKTTEYIANKQNAQTEDIKAQLARNGGILDQKECKVYATTAKDALKKANEDLNADLADQEQTCESEGNESESCLTATDRASKSLAKLNSLTNAPKVEEPCLTWETVTPGSLIKDRVSTTLNSDIRQLELAKDINDSLNAVFSMLLSKLQTQGLTSLSQGENTFDTDLGGADYNNFTYDEVDVNGNITRSSGAGFNGSIDLTKELGNTFNHDPRKSLGEWNAGSNDPKLFPGVGTKDTFYIVSVPGKTKLINDGYNGWEKGDRAYFDGTIWQNWKKGVANPIEKRGIIQIQKDYVVGATEILGVLPNVMPKLGELDRCIPGPNPNWQANMQESLSLLGEYINTTSTSYNGNGFMRNQDLRYYMAGPGDTEYENYKKIFDGSSKWWNGLKGTYALDQLMAMTYPREQGERESDSSKATFAEQVQNLLSRINSHLNEFPIAYDKLIRETYGAQSPLQNEFVKNELSGFKYDAFGNKIKNKGYLPMAQAGLEITKDILSYEEETNLAIQDYKDSIAEANSNVAKLEEIKKKVTLIVEKAQEERKKMFLEEYGITEAEYKEKYKDCIEEEKIIYYDEDKIMSDSKVEDGARCRDGIDNDLDGLIDSRDKDCPNYVTPEVRTSTDTTTRSGSGHRR